MTNRFVHALATGFGVGYFPGIPGTVGTIVGVAFAALLHPLSGWQFAAITGVFCVLAIWIADQALPAFVGKDPKQIVVDEVAGYLVTLVGHPFSWPIAVAAFILFRLFDITKPPPCRRVERWRGGLGICADDIIAGVYANLLLWSWVPLSHVWDWCYLRVGAWLLSVSLVT